MKRYDLKGVFIAENSSGVLNFQGVVLIGVRREELGFVGQEGLGVDFGFKFYNLQLEYVNNCMHTTS